MAFGMLGCVERGLRKGFLHYGDFVGRHPYFFLFIPIIICGIAAGGLWDWEEDSRVWYIFSPSDAPSHEEHRIMNQFFQADGGKFRLAFGIWCEDGGSILREEYLHQVSEVLDYVTYNISVQYGGEVYTYRDLCGTHCEDNDIVKVFSRAFHDKRFRHSPNFRMTWPMMNILQEHYYVGQTFGGVTLSPRSREIESVRIVMFRFLATKSTPRTEAILGEWEQKVLGYATKEFNRTGLLSSAISDGIISKEVSRNGYYCAPFVGVSLVFIFIFVLASSLHKDPIRSKPWEAVGGVMTPVLSLITTFGLLLAISGDFIALNIVVPFLILAIGVDDAFIMIHAWHKSDPKASVPHRLAEAMSDAGPSISMTSSTNMISFLIGAFSTTPGIRMFCLYAAVGVAMAFGFQITLFTAIIALGGRREAAAKNAYLICVKSRTHKVNIAGPMSTVVMKPSDLHINNNKNGHRSGRTTSSHHHHQQKTPLRIQHSCASARFADSWMTRFFAAYSALICSRRMKATVGVCLILYWALASWGFSRMEVVMSPDKTLLDDSPLHNFLQIVDAEMTKAGGEIFFFVRAPPDFRQPDQLRSFIQIIREIEALPKSMGSNSTALWLRPYLHDLSFKSHGGGNNIGSMFYQHLKQWLEEHKQWAPYVKFSSVVDNDIDSKENHQISTEETDKSNTSDHQHLIVQQESNKIDSFFFTTGIKGVSEWDARVEALQTWRGLTEKYGEYKISVAQYGSFYVDQQMSIKAVTVMTVSMALIVMFFICMLFIPNFTSVLCATGAVLSINLGVFGLLNLWNVDLDPISMITILMSIGFSVDFTCHISYHYYKSDIHDPQERLADALVAIGWPMVQAGVSTLLGIFVLVFPRSYMTLVFVKTSFLVVFLGLVHGLIVLPVVLTSIPQCTFPTTSLFNASTVLPQFREKNLRGGPTAKTGTAAAARNTSDSSFNSSSQSSSSSPQLRATTTTRIGSNGNNNNNTEEETISNDSGVNVEDENPHNLSSSSSAGNNGPESSSSPSSSSSSSPTSTMQLQHNPHHYAKNTMANTTISSNGANKNKNDNNKKKKMVQRTHQKLTLAKKLDGHKSSDQDHSDRSFVLRNDSDHNSKIVITNHRHGSETKTSPASQSSAAAATTAKGLSRHRSCVGTGIDRNCVDHITTVRVVDSTTNHHSPSPAADQESHAGSHTRKTPLSGTFSI